MVPGSLQTGRICSSLISPNVYHQVSERCLSWDVTLRRFVSKTALLKTLWGIIFDLYIKNALFEEQSIMILLLPLSVTRRDKIHGGVSRVSREIFGCWHGVR